MRLNSHRYTGTAVGSQDIVAARQGYLDALDGLPFDPGWEDADGRYQRNYESGRLWAVAIKAAGLIPALWQDNSRIPAEVLAQLATARERTGSGARPEDWARDGLAPPPDNSPLHAVVPRVVRGRIVERLTAQ